MKEIPVLKDIWIKKFIKRYKGKQKGWVEHITWKRAAVLFAAWGSEVSVYN